MTTYLGDAIISNTQLYEVDKLLNTPKEKKTMGTIDYDVNNYSGSLRVFDLLTLIEAIILNDQLYTLPTTDNNIEGPLIKTLKEEGIVNNLRTDNFKVDIGKSILSKLKNVKEFKKYEGSESEILNPIEINKIFQGIETFYNTIARRATDLSYDEDELQVNRADSFEDIAQKLMGWIDYEYAGVYKSCIPILRDMYYIFTSEYLEMPYYPQCTRINFAKNFPNYYDTNFKTKLFAQIAKSLEATISDVYDDFQEKVAFIPPFSSIVLNRSQKHSDIIKNTLELREEFQKTRKGFNELELARRDSKNLKERLKISKRQRLLLEDAAKVFNNFSNINLTSIVKYIPEVIKPITGPTDPTKYSANLLMQPIEVILEWWRKRPIIKMYSMKHKLFEIKEYHELIDKLFPNSLNNLHWQLR